MIVYNKKNIMIIYYLSLNLLYMIIYDYNINIFYIIGI